MQVSNKDQNMFPQKPQNIISPYQVGHFTLYEM